VAQRFWTGDEWARPARYELRRHAWLRQHPPVSHALSLELDTGGHTGGCRAVRELSLRALLFDGTLRFEAHAPRPPGGHGEALLRVRLAGICSTDLEITRGYKGFTGVLGHEFVGEVVESPDSRWCGQRVCGEINIGCGSCPLCRVGLRTHCERRTVLGILGYDGAFADYVALPLVNLHPVPSQITDDEAVFVEPLAAAFEILEQIGAPPRGRTVVLGDGKLGILCAQVLALAGADLLVVGKHPEKLSLLEDMGISTALLSDGPAEADLVVEATGSSGGLRAAMEMVRPRGTLVMKSTTADENAADLSPLVVKEITVIGSRCGPFPRAIDALVHEQVQVRPLIHARYPLEEGVAAMECAREPGVLKVLLDVNAH